MHQGNRTTGLAGWTDENDHASILFPPAILSGSSAGLQCVKNDSPSEKNRLFVDGKLGSSSVWCAYPTSNRAPSRFVSGCLNPRAAPQHRLARVVSLAAEAADPDKGANERLRLRTIGGEVIQQAKVHLVRRAACRDIAAGERVLDRHSRILKRQ
jgi:hypothetical protein